MLARLLPFSALLVIACSGSPDPPFPTALATPYTSGEAQAASMLDTVEAQLLSASTLRVEGHVVAEGAVAADLRVVVDMQAGQRVRMTASGTLGGAEVSLSYVADGRSTSLGGPTPPQLQQAVILGWIRMGFMHNVARLRAGKEPDRAAGGVADWVRARAPEFGPPRIGSAANQRVIDFGLQVAGQDAGEVSLAVEEDSLRPLDRVQIVRFPSGEMRVKESYEVSFDQVHERHTFTTAASCQRDIDCLAGVCTLGDQTGCESAGLFLAHGLASAGDGSSSTAMWLDSCHRGHGSSCALAARYLWKEFNKQVYRQAKQLEEQARRHWQVACKWRNAAACANLEANKGFQSPPAGPLAIRTYETLCAAQELDMCRRLATELLASKRAADKERARALLDNQCYRDAEACWMLGRRLSVRHGVALFHRGCALGDERSCDAEIDALSRIPERAADGRRARSAACARGRGPHCLAAARSLPTGDRRHLGFLERGCQVGSVGACDLLGDYFAQGRVVPRDDRRSVDLYRQSAAHLMTRCRRDHLQSCNELAQRHEHGRKSPRNARAAAEVLAYVCQQQTGLGNEQSVASCREYRRLSRLARIRRTSAEEKVFLRLMCAGAKLVGSCLRAARQDPGEAAYYHRVACDLGTGTSCYTAGQLLVGNRPFDPSARSGEGYRLFRQGCERGDHLSCGKAGYLDRACASGQGSYDACVALAEKMRVVDREGQPVGDGDHYCRLACRAWSVRDHNDRRASGRNPALHQTCRRVRPCR